MASSAVYESKPLLSGENSLSTIATSFDEPRIKAVEEYRRRFREHRELETKLRDMRLKFRELEKSYD